MLSTLSTACWCQQRTFFNKANLNLSCVLRDSRELEALRKCECHRNGRARQARDSRPPWHHPLHAGNGNNECINFSSNQVLHPLRGQWEGATVDASKTGEGTLEGQHMYPIWASL